MKADLDFRKFFMKAASELVHAYYWTFKKGPKETAKVLVDRIGKKDAVKVVSVMVIAKGGWDERISRQNQTWASECFSQYSKEDLNESGIYYRSDIHPAHMNQIADALRAM